MRGVLLIVLSTLLFAGNAAALSTDDATQPQVGQAATQKDKGPAKTGGGRQPAKPAGTFRPTEKISADSAVSFPVDI